MTKSLSKGIVCCEAQFHIAPARKDEFDTPMTLILAGLYGSPFVRRIAVALNFYEMKYGHRPWSIFEDAAELEILNPYDANGIFSRRLSKA